MCQKDKRPANTFSKNNGRNHILSAEVLSRHYYDEYTALNTYSNVTREFFAINKERVVKSKQKQNMLDSTSWRYSVPRTPRLNYVRFYSVMRIIKLNLFPVPVRYR